MKELAQRPGTRSSRPVRLLAWCLLGAFAASSAFGQCDPPPGDPSSTRPRIGLALSGGGARGIAHLGVIKVLEDLGVPIDCIAGTSMGAIVGGYYAAGYSPEQIERELINIDWYSVFRGKPARESLSFRSKEIDNRYLLGLEIGWNNKRLASPGGALSAFELEFHLQRLALPVLGIDDFDDFPTPFRAIAADLEVGERVVLSSGDLAQAIRASVSLPGIFPPVVIGGRRLVDGSVVDDLPVDVVRNMGADIVIAVDAGIPFYPGDRLASMASVMTQALSIAVQRAVSQQRDNADLLIVPELAGFGSFDFAKLEAIIEEGAVAARARSSEFSELATHEQPRRRQGGVDQSQERLITEIRVRGLGRVDERLVRARLQTKVGEALDLNVLLADLGRVVQIGEFESVGFSLEPTADGSALVLRAAEKPWGPHYIRFGARLSGELPGTTSLSVLANYTQTSLNALGAEWRNDFQIGETRRVFSEIYQPLHFEDRFFAAGSVESRIDTMDIYQSERKVAEYEVETGLLGLDLGAQIGKYGQIRFGARWGAGRAESVEGALDLPKVDVTLAGIEGRIVIDRLDSATVPRKGQLAEVQAFRSEPGLGADDAYTKVKANYAGYFTTGRHTFFLGLTAGSALDTELPTYDKFTLGGLFSFSGFHPGELRGDHFAVARPGYFYRIFDLPPSVGVAAYVGGWLEAGNMWQDHDSVSADDLAYSVTLAAALDTRIGAVYIGYGYAERGSGYFQLLVGPHF